MTRPMAPVKFVRTEVSAARGTLLKILPTPGNGNGIRTGSPLLKITFGWLFEIGVDLVIG